MAFELDSVTLSDGDDRVGLVSLVILTSDG